MAPATTARGMARSNSATRCLRVLLLLIITGVLDACGGGAIESMSGGGGGSIPGVCVTGTTATQLFWDPVSNAARYRVYVGTAPGMYSQPFGQGVDVGLVTTTPVPGLSPATTYYFAVTSVDSAGNESSYSNEACKTTT